MYACTWFTSQMFSGGGGDDEGDRGCGLEGTKEECDFSLKSCRMFLLIDGMFKLENKNTNQ